MRSVGRVLSRSGPPDTNARPASSVAAELGSAAGFGKTWFHDGSLPVLNDKGDATRRQAVLLAAASRSLVAPRPVAS